MKYCLNANKNYLIVKRHNEIKFGYFLVFAMKIFEYWI